MEFIAACFEGVFKLIIEVFAKTVLELLIHGLIARTGIIIRRLFKFKIIVKDEMDEWGASIFDYVLGIGFYILLGFGICYLC